MKEPAEPTTPAALRDRLFADPARLSDPQLVSLIVGKGTQRKRRGQPTKRWSFPEIGEALCARGGGGCVELVEAVVKDAIDLADYGLGPTLGTRLRAVIELARRWRRGFARGGNAEIRSDPDHRGPDLQEVLQSHGKVSEGELVMLVIDENVWRHENTDALLGAFERPREVMESVAFDAFVTVRREGRTLFSLPETELKLTASELGRLLSAVELARRYRSRAKVERRKPVRGPSGLSALDLVKILDPRKRLEDPLRERLARLVRTHPEVAEDFRALDELAADVGVESPEEAVEVGEKLETLTRTKKWSDPAEVLGPPVPFAKLLALAEARLDREEKPHPRLEDVRDRLLAAQREAIRKPVESFVEALRELHVTDEGAQQALEDARRGYFGAAADASC